MKLLITLLSFFAVLVTQAQNKQLLYNVDELPQTLMSNPGASIDFDGHFGIPFLTQIHLSAGSSGVNLYDIFSDSDPNVNVRVTNTIQKLTYKDYFTVQEQITVLYAGWRLNKDNYLSAGVYQELDMFSYFPKDPAVLVSEGNNDYINIPFDFSHIAFTGEIMTIYHLGLNKKIDPHLTIGGRLKFYSGIFNVESVDNSGFFITRNNPDRPNYYTHYVENLNIRVNTSGYASLQDKGMTVQEATADLLKRSFFGGNIGVGVDLGGTYLFSENFIATASILDVGAVFHQKDVENYLYSGSYETDGLEPLFPEIGGNGQTLPYWDIFEDEIDANLKDETLQEEYTTWRPFKLNGSLEYGFGKRTADCNYRYVANRRFMNRAGIQLYGINRPLGIKYAFTTYYDKKFNDTFRMKMTYTLDDFSYTNIGLMASVNWKNFNAYLAAGNLLGYTNLAKSQRESIQFGLQFIFRNNEK